MICALIGILDDAHRAGALTAAARTAVVLCALSADLEAIRSELFEHRLTVLAGVAGPGA